MQTPIKIFFVITSLGIGGAERLLYLHLKYLDRRRFAPTVVTIVRGGVFAKEIEHLGIRVIHLQKSSKLGLLTLFRLWRIFLKERPTIVHTHLFGGDTWGRIPAILARIPIIISTEHLMNLDEQGGKRLLKRFLSRWTDLILPVSHAVFKFSQEVDRIPERKLKMIYAPVDIENFNDIPPLSKIEHRLAFIGRLEERKGHRIFIHAMQRLIKTFPNLVAVIAYPSGDEEVERRLKNLVKELSLEKNIHWMKDVVNIRPILENTDFVVVPSFYEGLGMVAMEAMAAGRVVVASNVHGLNEVVEHQRTGVLVPPKDPSALADAMKDLFEHPDLAIAYALAGKKQVSNKFGIRSFVEKMNKVYFGFLQKKRPQYENITGQ